MAGAKTAAFALQKIHFSNGRFWRKADVGLTGDEGPALWGKAVIRLLAQSGRIAMAQPSRRPVPGISSRPPASEIVFPIPDPDGVVAPVP
jgi:hypothetical protein